MRPWTSQNAEVLSQKESLHEKIVRICVFKNNETQVCSVHCGAGTNARLFIEIASRQEQDRYNSAILFYILNDTIKELYNTTVFYDLTQLFDSIELLRVGASACDKEPSSPATQGKVQKIWAKGSGKSSSSEKSPSSKKPSMYWERSNKSGQKVQEIPDLKIYISRRVDTDIGYKLA